MSYKETRFWENFNVEQFPTEGEYSIPILEPYDYEPTEFIGFNFARSAKNKSEKGLHFFVDDYQFERLWREPLKHINLIGEFHSIMTPDFSLYTDFPKALQIYNHYRKMWLGALWQSYGYKVIPTIAWSDKDSFAWCFSGVPKCATVAVSSVGTQQSKDTKQAFLDGWNEMLKRLEPETVIFHGNVPKECNANIIRIKSFSEKFKEVKTDYGWQR